MSVRFVDTNILIYAISSDPGERDKAERANRILAERELGLSVQVLQEFYVQATREGRPGRLTHQRATALVASFRRFPVAPLTADLASAAMATCDRFQISYWDAAILEAARTLGCETVLSEDLGDGQDYDGVRVENPFRPGEKSDGR
jgi:predicted nucleic acid-binding protein